MVRFTAWASIGGLGGNGLAWARSRRDRLLNHPASIKKRRRCFANVSV